MNKTVNESAYRYILGGRHVGKLRKIDITILVNKKFKSWLKERKKTFMISANSKCAGCEEGGRTSAR